MSDSELGIQERNGAIVLTLGEAYAILPPDQAVAVGEALIKHAYHIKTGSTPEARQAVTAEMETRTATKVTQNIKRGIETNRLPGHIAKDCISIVMHEML